MFLQTINFRKISKHIFKQTRDYKGGISAIFSAVFQWQIQAYSHISWHNQAYLNIFKHNQPYLGNIQAYSDISRTLCNHARLRTIAHLELEAHLEPCQRSTMKRFVKIVKIVYDYIFDANHNYCRDISSSRSLLYGMNTIFFKYRSNFYF